MNISDYLKQLQWRYATKLFDPNRKLSVEQMQFVKDTLRFSPSSTGIQPWKFVIVTNPDVLAKLSEAGYKQPQITSCAALVVFCRLTEVTTAHIHTVLENTAVTRGVTPAALDGYLNLMLGVLKNKNEVQLQEWASDQVYIALGMLISACAVVGIDACPMEGFDRKAFDMILVLAEEGCTSYAICALGFRSPDDTYAKLAKARLPENQVIIEK